MRSKMRYPERVGRGQTHSSGITLAMEREQHCSVGGLIGEANMRVIRGNQILTVMAPALIVGMVLVASDSSLAQEKKKVSWSTKPENTKIIVQQALEVPDMAGHVIRITEFRRSWPDGGGPVVEGQKVLEEVAYAFSDTIAGNGHGSGYGTWYFDSGDRMFREFQSAIQTAVNPDRSRKTTFMGTYVTTGGTGRFKGIKGLGIFSGRAELDTEGKKTRNEYSAEGEYWFEK